LVSTAVLRSEAEIGDRMQLLSFDTLGVVGRPFFALKGP